MVKDDNQESDTGLQEFYERREGRWRLLILYVLAALVLSFLAVYGGRAIYRHYHKTAVTPAPTITKQSSSLVEKNNHKSNSKQSTNNLPNSGPGQVVGLFVGTSIVAAGLHFIVQRRRSY